MSYQVLSQFDRTQSAAMSIGVIWPKAVLNGPTVEWWPIIAIGSAGAFLDASKDGTWLVCSSGTAFLAGEPESRVRLLPMLEKALAEISTAVSRELVDQNLSPTDGLQALLGLVIEAGLCAGSDYWASLALVWLEATVHPMYRIRQCAAELVNQPWASQRTKHRARRLLRRVV